MNKLSERLKELREEKGLSQRELAIAIGITNSTIARIENKILTTNIDILIKLALYFKVTTDYLLGLED